MHIMNDHKILKEEDAGESWCMLGKETLQLEKVSLMCMFPASVAYNASVLKQRASTWPLFKWIIFSFQLKPRHWHYEIQFPHLHCFCGDICQPYQNVRLMNRREHKDMKSSTSVMIDKFHSSFSNSKNISLTLSVYRMYVNT